MDLGGLVQASPHAVLLVRPDGGLVWGNHAALDLLGGPERLQVGGGSLLGLLARRHRTRAGQLLAAVAAGARGGPVYLTLEGEAERWVAVRGAPAEGGLAQLAVVDVTEAVLARRSLRASERRFRAAFEASVTGMALLDTDERIALANPALEQVLQRPAASLVGLPARELLHEDDRGGGRTLDLDLERAPLRVRRPGGEVRHVLVSSRRLDPDPRAPRFVQVEDVTERHVHEQRLRHLALHDALTDLPGRPLVLSRLDAALLQPDEGVTAVLFLDLDGFKLVNDALGHAAGDQVLVEAAHRLRAAVRPGDTVGRFGGDEFLVVCPGLPSREDALAVARRVERAISTPFPFQGDEVLVSASVGVAFAEPGTSAEVAADDLVRDADTAMYRAKQLGKRRFEVFDQAMRERAAERLRVEQVLSRAVVEDRVVVHYQPFVDLQSRRVVGVEALMRVRDDDGSLLVPGVFLEVARESGVLPQLDDVVLLEAATQGRRWAEQTGRDLEVSVNICAVQVSSELPAKVRAVLEASGLAPERLVLEITEQALVSSAPSAGEALQQVADSGVRLALDDFGTGWASLTYLRRFPVSIVKVDRSFVAGLPHVQDDVVIVKAVVDLARQLGVLCVAEGVETEEQYASLRAMDPPFAQGYLFGRALPADELARLL